MAANLYRGFSTKIFRGVDTAVHDRLLVNQDLLNVFNTPLGSRVGRGRWGSIIPLMVFELGSEDSERAIDNDVTRIINSDPRVSLVRKIVNVDLDTHSVTVDLLLNYVELSVQDWVSIPVKLVR